MALSAFVTLETSSIAQRVTVQTLENVKPEPSRIRWLMSFAVVCLGDAAQQEQEVIHLRPRGCAPKDPCPATFSLPPSASITRRTLTATSTHVMG